MTMKKFCSVLVIIITVFILGCDKEEDKTNKEIVVPDMSELNQSVFADETSTGGITFTAVAPWTTVLREIRPEVQKNYTGYNEKIKKEKITWLFLDRYSGDAGQFTLSIILEPNYTGTTRMAEIDIRAGTTVLTVKVVQEGVTQTGEIPKPPVAVENIILNETYLEMNVGDKETLIATVYPVEATVKDVIWSSDNIDIIAVDESTGEITALAEGLATVRVVSATDNSKKATCSVKVTDVKVAIGEGIFTYTKAADPLRMVYADQKLYPDMSGGAVCFYTENEAGEIINTDFYLSFYFRSPSNRLPEGIYTWSDRGGSPGEFYIQKGGFNDEIFYVIGGKAIVSVSEDEYTVSLELTTYQNSPAEAKGKITGNYRGKIKIVK